jgi:hypothetical protein
MQSFGAAKFILGLLMVIGWFVFFVAVVGFFIANAAFGMFPSLAGAAVVGMSGLIVIASSQMAMAQIATAENTKEMLNIMQGKQAAREFPDSPDRSEPSFRKAPPPLVKNSGN